MSDFSLDSLLSTRAPSIVTHRARSLGVHYCRARVRFLRKNMTR